MVLPPLKSVEIVLSASAICLPQLMDGTIVVCSTKQAACEDKMEKCHRIDPCYDFFPFCPTTSSGFLLPNNAQSATSPFSPSLFL